MTNLKFPHRFGSQRQCITPILLLKRERGARNLVLLSLSLVLWSLLTCRIQSLRECLCRCLLIPRIVLFAFFMRTLLFSFEIDLCRKNLDCRFFRVRFFIGILYFFIWILVFNYLDWGIAVKDSSNYFLVIIILLIAWN